MYEKILPHIEKIDSSLEASPFKAESLFLLLIILNINEGILTVPDDTNLPRETVARRWSGVFPAGTLVP